MTAILSVRDYLASFLGPYLPLRCGSPGAICGGARLGVGAPWPFDWTDTTAYCGRARCGAAHCGRIAENGAFFAGIIPAMKSHHITLTLTEDMGGRPDPRQRYGTAYDNPSFTLHIIGDRLDWLDAVADCLRTRCDRGAHITTEDGYINGIRIAPPQRDIRTSRPRYDVTMRIETEVIRQ